MIISLFKSSGESTVIHTCNWLAVLLVVGFDYMYI